MKKYYVNVHYDLCFRVEVMAESEEAATAVAEDMVEEMEMTADECTFRESCITGSEIVNE